MDERAYVSRTNGDRAANLDAIRAVFAQAAEALKPLAIEEYRYQRRRGVAHGGPARKEAMEVFLVQAEQLLGTLGDDVYRAELDPDFRLFPEPSS